MMNDSRPKSSQVTDAGMSDTRISFYKKNIDKWIDNKNASILVVGGGDTDYTVFHSLNFSTVTISNLDDRFDSHKFAPYNWSFQKAEQLSYESESFDFVVVHAALHHCESPHRALLEMYRVARSGIIAFESRDSLLMRLLGLLQVTPEYEHVAVYDEGGKAGGVNNTEIPNYIYRWTEREVEKLISSYAPHAKHQFKYQYGNDVPSSVSYEKRVAVKSLVIALLRPFYQIFSLLFPQQQNLFAFYVSKPSLPADLRDWLKLDSGVIQFNMDWARQKYK
jgi:SAM-dependent methyltransferase